MVGHSELLFRYHLHISALMHQGRARDDFFRGNTHDDIRVSRKVSSHRSVLSDREKKRWHTGLFVHVGNSGALPGRRAAFLQLFPGENTRVSGSLKAAATQAVCLPLASTALRRRYLRRSHLSEYDVKTVQPCGLCRRHEELAAVRVRPAICHRQKPWTWKRPTITAAIKTEKKRRKDTVCSRAEKRD